jgi:iron complex outermembrane receptor protein
MDMNTPKRKPLISAVSVSTLFLSIGLCLGSTSFAQGTNEGTRASLEEIVVTARKRDELLLDTPLAITAFSAADIEAQDIKGLHQISDFSPGLFYAGHTVGRNDRSNRRLTFRSMEINTDVQSRQAATLFIDGAPVLASEFGAIEGVERIEVIKGPQSAYFGRSTFSGAINIITKTPTGDWGGRITAEAANFGTSEFSVSFEGPVFGDNVAFRLGAYQMTTEGQYINAANPSEKLGARKTDDFSLTLHATPTDNFSVRFRAHYWEDDDGPGASVAYGNGNREDAFNCTDTLVPWICGEFPPPSSGDQIAQDAVATREIQENLLGNGSAAFFLFDPQFIDGFGLAREAMETSLILDYEFSNGIQISSISAWHSNDWAALDDFDGRETADPLDPFFDVILFNNNSSEDFSQELRVTSSQDSKFTWMIGGNYFDLTNEATSGFQIFGTFRSFNPGEHHEVTTKGLFAAIGYDIASNISVSLEARNQWDEVADAVRLSDPLTGTFESFTPRLIVEYKPTENTMLYGAYAEGNRPGEFNPTVVGRPQNEIDQIVAESNAGLSVPEETLTNFEVGFKGSFFEDRADISVAVYSGEWRDVHIRSSVNVTKADGTVEFVPVTAANGSVDIQGVEIEGRFLVTDHLRIEGSYAYNATEFVAGFFVPPTLYDPPPPIGSQMNNSPLHSGSAAVVYENALTNEWDWFARADYIGKGTNYGDTINLAETGATNLVHIRAGVESDSLRLEAFVTNLTDDDTVKQLQSLTDFGYAPGVRAITAALQDRRMYGLRMSYNF